MNTSETITKQWAQKTYTFDQAPKALFLKVGLNKEVAMFARLFNPEGLFIGQIIFGHNHDIKMLYIGPEGATLNAMAHTLMAGTYTVETLAIGREKDLVGLEITIELKDDAPQTMDEKNYQTTPWFGPKGCLLAEDKVHQSGTGWYKGDFHSHTTMSDGQVSPEAVGSYLDYEDLDFTAITEHNLVAFGFRETGKMMLPSFELTLPGGHMNIHGLKTPNLMATEKAVSDLFEGRLNSYLGVMGKGAHVAINHMFMAPWDFQYSQLDLTLINAIEVLCDPTYKTAPEANDKAVAFLDFLWTKGFKIYAIGGSDSHNLYASPYEGSTLPSVYGDPGTYVHCQDLSVANVLAALRHGHSYVARFFRLDIDMGGLLPGDIVPEGQKRPYRVSLSSHHPYVADKTFTGRFIVDNKVVMEKRLSPEDREMALEDIEAYLGEASWTWLRFGLYDGDGHVIAYVNPVYRGMKKPEHQGLGIYLEEFLTR